MARSSFLIKGWCITLVAALVALSAKEDNPEILIVTLIPILIFWILDGFFLYQERLYRPLYDSVRQSSEDQINFSMNTNDFKGRRNTWLWSTLSKTFILLCISLLLLLVIVYLFLQCI